MIHGVRRTGTSQSSACASDAGRRFSANGQAFVFVLDAEVPVRGKTACPLGHGKWTSRPIMALNFPNASRSYDERRGCVRFWGYDSSLEIAFFVDVAALQQLSPSTPDEEDGYLTAFDAALERIHSRAMTGSG